MIEDDVFAMRDAGMNDGAILRPTRSSVTSIMSTSLNGLGVTTVGDIVGYYQDGQSKENEMGYATAKPLDPDLIPVIDVTPLRDGSDPCPFPKIASGQPAARVYLYYRPRYS